MIQASTKTQITVNYGNTAEVKRVENGTIDLNGTHFIVSSPTLSLTVDPDVVTIRCNESVTDEQYGEITRKTTDKTDVISIPVIEDETEVSVNIDYSVLSGLLNTGTIMSIIL